jgi:putative flippase GtrA
MVKYGLVGVINTCIGLGLIFAAMYFLQLNPYLANIFGYSCALIASFFMNKNWTFQSNGNAGRKFVLFLLIVGVSYLVQIAVLYILLESGINMYLAQIFAMVVYVVLGFVGHKLITFRDI